MSRYLFDLETDGLIPSLTRIHCVVLKDIDTGEVISAHGTDAIVNSLLLIENADLIAGHNIINFDIPAIQKLYPEFMPKGTVRDTLVLSRLIWTDIKDRDMNAIRKGKLPGKLLGSHSLKAWGYRLGVLKGDFGETSDWSTWTPEMQEYCELDVEVTQALWDRIESKDYSQQAIELEHEFAKVIQKQVAHGWTFDSEQAVKLYAKLGQERAKLADALKTEFGEWFQSTGVKTPKRTLNYKDKLRGDLTEGAKYTTIKLVQFNPSSRDHIARCLTGLHNWKPKAFTPAGKATIDDSVLIALPYPEAKRMARYFLIEKRVSQLAEGRQAWLKKVDTDGRIHGSVNTNGAVTGRCTHSHPNVAQVPSSSAVFGKECRALFTAAEGMKQIGCDASGLELRTLAHYLARYDNGDYAQKLVEDDIHWIHAIALGLPGTDKPYDSTDEVQVRSRNKFSKTFIYAYLYGAGNVKLGSILKPTATEKVQEKLGGKLKKRFEARITGLGQLKKAVSDSAKKGWIKGLDGRRLHIRSAHAALNTLLQSAGALVMKQALVNAYAGLNAAGLTHGKEYGFTGNIHDEIQTESTPELSESIGIALRQGIVDAGLYFHLRCPLDGEFHIGSSWAETH